MDLFYVSSEIKVSKSNKEMKKLCHSPSKLQFNESWLGTFSYSKLSGYYLSMTNCGLKYFFSFAKQTGNSTSAICLKNSRVLIYLIFLSVIMRDGLMRQGEMIKEFTAKTVDEDSAGCHRWISRKEI